jgi:hypothetical protein
LADEQASERAERELERLAKEERRAAFEPYSTLALWAWGADHEGWTIPRDRAIPSGRKAILDALVKGKALVPRNLQAVQRNWRKVAGTAAPFPSRDREADAALDDDEAQPAPSGAEALEDELERYEDEEYSSDDEGEEAEQLAAKERAVHDLLQEIQARKEKAARRSAAAAAGATSAAAAAASPPSAVCKHCTVPLKHLAQACGHCGTSPLHPPDGEHNKSLRSLVLMRLQAANPLGQSTTLPASTSGGGGASSKAHTKRDKEFERLIKEGKPQELFAKDSPLSHTDALLGVEVSYNAADYQPPSVFLQELIRAGLLKDVGFAIPRTLASVKAAREKGDAMLSVQGGTVSVVDSIHAPPVHSLSEVVEAFVCAIGPSLIDRPAALVEWFALLRTLVEIDKAWGWPAARTYMDRALERAYNQGPNGRFGKYKAAFLDARLTMFGPQRGAAGAAAANGGSQQKNGAGGGNRETGAWSAMHPDACRKFNLFDSCTGAGCNYKHLCCWPACFKQGATHQGKDCPNKPAGWTPPRSADKKSGGGRKAGGGGGGGAGAAGAGAAKKEL